MNDEEARSDDESTAESTADSEHVGSQPSEPEPTGASSAQTDEGERQAGAWDDVADALNDLGKAVTTWAAAFKDDPETRRHAGDLQQGFERLGRQMGDALDSVAESDFGRSVAQAAGRAGTAMGDAARKAGDQVSPFVVSTLRGASEGIRRAADRLDKRGAEVAAEAAEGSAEPPPAPEPPVPPEPPPPPAPEQEPPS